MPHALVQLPVARSLRRCDHWFTVLVDLVIFDCYLVAFGCWSCPVDVLNLSDVIVLQRILCFFPTHTKIFEFIVVIIVALRRASEVFAGLCSVEDPIPRITMMVEK